MTTLTAVPSSTLTASAHRGPSFTVAKARAAASENLSTTLTRLLRFSLVGVLNTCIDVVALNLLVWLFTLRTTPVLLVANAVAYALGAVNSFAFNRCWTFDRRGASTGGEVGRFIATTLAGMILNDALFWMLSKALVPMLGSTQLWANAAEVGAIGGTVLLSYVGMRLWVFAQRAPSRAAVSDPPAAPALWAPRQTQRMWMRDNDRCIEMSKVLAHHSLSVVLPAYNEEQAIEATVTEVVSTLDAWDADFEVLVVNDGSVDRTEDIVAGYSLRDPRVHLITHASNQGYGAALKSGFAAASKDLTLFMDADGQFSIHDLAHLLLQIDAVDAVLGYRIQRQDSWLRLVNAWGWKVLVHLALGVQVKDLDCAFKLIRTEFLHAYPPTTGSALINAELVYTLHRTGARYVQVGVRHLPRRAGRATGAHPRVILRALRDLAINAWRWRRRIYSPLRSTS
ncbi:MAG: glycosyltransferase [Ktedonobacterales bacterium]